MADLKGTEVKTDIKTKKMDAINLPMLMRACNLNPSQVELEGYGATTNEGQKVFTLEEVLNIFSESKKNIKNQGCYEDFVECLKLYDKNENGLMLAAELSHSLLCLGEKLNDKQVDELFDDCLPEENDDGEIEYDIFLRKMCDKPPKA